MNDEIVTLGTFPTSEEAYIVKGLLEANGIRAVVNDSYISSLYGNMVPALDARVCVFASDLEDARSILASTGNI